MSVQWVPAYSEQIDTKEIARCKQVLVTTELVKKFVPPKKVARGNRTSYKRGHWARFRSVGDIKCIMG